jgi:NADH-quinone oxidoreductase subunit N
LKQAVNLQSIVDNLLNDTLQVSLPLFRPELALCATIVAMLLVRVFRWGEKIDPFLIALVGTAYAFWSALPAGGMSKIGEVASQELFTGMLVYDSMTVFFRLFLAGFAAWLVVLVRMTGLADRQDGQDFYTLLLGSTLGMCLMASANHLVIVFLGVEMASVPSYVMAGIIKGRQRASEAALKYAVFGAGAAGVMLYGISLLAGLVGSAHLPTIAERLAAMDIPGKIATGQDAGTLMVLALAGLMIMVGLAFKLSAVPFHFWCPDVFEGASAEVDAFLSVASKAAAMALLVRVALGVSTLHGGASVAVGALAEPVPPISVPLASPVLVAAGTVAQPVSSAALAEPVAPGVDTLAEPVARDAPLAPVRSFIVRLLAIVAAVTATFGNLAAYGQTNMKRLLAYSTIAHAGYMIMAVAAAVASTSVAGTHQAVAALMFYLAVYVSMNLGAFAVVALVRNAMQSEEIADYAGLVRSCPVTSVALVTILVSLIGIPPLAGFFGKFYIFYALFNAGGPWMISLLVIACANTIVSLVYYVRVAKTVCMDPEPAGRGPVSLGRLAPVYVFVVTLPVLVFGIFPQTLAALVEQASRQLLM